MGLKDTIGTLSGLGWTLTHSPIISFDLNGARERNMALADLVEKANRIYGKDMKEAVSNEFYSSKLSFWERYPAVKEKIMSGKMEG